MNSRAKGARGERMAAAAWAEAIGLPQETCRRGQQFAGGTDSPDVVQPIAGIHLEVKNTERGNPYLWVAQAVRDGGQKVPVVLHKRNGQDWLAVVRLTDVRRFAAEIHTAVSGLGQQSLSLAVPGANLPEASLQDGRRPRVLRHERGPGAGDDLDTRRSEPVPDAGHPVRGVGSRPGGLAKRRRGGRR